MTPQAITKFAILSLTLLACGTGCCCVGLPSLSPEERERLRVEREAREAREAEEREVAMARGLTRADAWTALADIVPRRPPLRVEPCPDGRLGEALGQPLLRTRAPTIDRRALDSARPGSAWEFLQSGDAQYFVNWHESRETSDSTRERWQVLMGQAENRFVVVFVGDERALASGVDDGGLFRRGGFEAAYFDGGIVVVDLDEQTVVCGAPVWAENSEEVAFDDRGALKTSLAEAVQRDFEDNLEEAANDALARITEHLSVNTVGLL